MASRTCDGSREPDVHADPLDPQIPFISSMIRSDSPSMNWKLKFALFGRRSALCPFRRTVWDLSEHPVDQMVTDLNFFCGTFFHGCLARSAAIPYPTIPGTFSVPARRFLSCAPPCTKERIFTPFTDVEEADSLWVR